MGVAFPLVAHSIDADATVATLDRIVTRRANTLTSSAATTGPSSRPAPPGLVPVHRFGTSCIDPRQPVAEPLGRVLDSRCEISS